MAKDNVIEGKKPEPFMEDPLTDILRQLLAAALEAEVVVVLQQYNEEMGVNGRCRIVQAPRIQNCQPDAQKERIRFTSYILPPYLSRTRSTETLLP